MERVVRVHQEKVGKAESLTKTGGVFPGHLTESYRKKKLYRDKKKFVTTAWQYKTSEKDKVNEGNSVS